MTFRVNEMDINDGAKLRDKTGKWAFKGKK